jgi:hypothetical protein
MGPDSSGGTPLILGYGKNSVLALKGQLLDTNYLLTLKLAKFLVASDSEDFKGHRILIRHG